MEKFKNDKSVLNRSLKEDLSRKNTTSIERIAMRMQPSSRIPGINPYKVVSSRNVYARIDSRVKKSRSLLDISDSKENHCPKAENAKEFFPKAAKISISSITSLASAPKLIPLFHNKFAMDIERLEPKLQLFYSQYK